MDTQYAFQWKADMLGLMTPQRGYVHNLHDWGATLCRSTNQPSLACSDMHPIRTLTATWRNSGSPPSAARGEMDDIKQRVH